MARRMTFIMLLLAGMPLLAAEGRLELVSRVLPRLAPDTAGGNSWQPSCSGDGRYVVFRSDARNVVTGQVSLGNSANVFLHDRLTGVTTLVSHAAGSPETTGDEHSFNPVVSADGAYVFFLSTARNLVSGGLGDQPIAAQLYQFERSTGTITLVSRRPVDGKPSRGNVGVEVSVNADASWAAFVSRATDLLPEPLQNGQNGTNVFLYERASGAVTLVSRSASLLSRAGNGDSVGPVLSADGRFVAYLSKARDLMAGQLDLAPWFDVFLFDRLTGTNTLVSHAATSAHTPGDRPSASTFRLSLNSDGRYLGFTSAATNLVAGVSDANGEPDVFLYDRLTNSSSLLNRAAGSPTATPPLGSYNPVLSADGNTVAYLQGTQNSGVSQVFVLDRLTGTATLVTVSAESPETPSNAGVLRLVLSADGRFLLFSSFATDLVAGQVDASQTLDVFLHDRTDGTTILVSHAAGIPMQTGGGLFSDEPVLSADGSWAFFSSYSELLDAGKRDSNLQQDVFLYERATATNKAVSLRAPALLSRSANSSSYFSALSGDGRYLAFTSRATDLVPGQVDRNDGDDVFLFDRLTGRRILVSRSSASARTSANSPSILAGISRDGTSVLFTSKATDLVPSQSGPAGHDQVFLFNRLTGTTILASRASASPTRMADADCVAGGLSADGNVVAFTSTATNLVVRQRDTNQGSDVFAFDRRNGVTTLLSHTSGSFRRTGEGHSFFTSMSVDGEWIAFSSAALNLVPGVPARPGPYPDYLNAYLFERRTGTVILLSKIPGPQGPQFGGSQATLSGDGRYVAFVSDDSTIRLFDRVSGRTSILANDLADLLGLSDDGRFVLFHSYSDVVFPGQDDHNSQNDLFLLDRTTGEILLASHVPGSPSRTGIYGAEDGRLSGDGRWVVFSRYSPELVSEASPFPQLNVFLYDRASGELALLSRSDSLDGEGGNGWSISPRVSAAGGFVTFSSAASDLVPGDFNGLFTSDVFLYILE